MEELICRSLTGRASAGEEMRLLAWRHESQANETQYREIAWVMGLVEHVEMDASKFGPPPLAKLISGGDVEVPRRAQRLASSHNRWGKWSATAMLGIAAAMVGIALIRTPTVLDQAAAFSLGAGEFVTGPGEAATVVLADGTVVRLAPDSRLRIPGTAGTRDVVLEGKAYFAVAKMPDRPFRVRTRAGEAVVLGTRFELSARGEDLRLVVVEGRVALAAEAGSVEVKAGEMSMISEGTTTSPLQIEDIRHMVGWIDRFVVFQSTPLIEVAEELSREYGVRVEVTDTLLSNQTISGWYADKPFEHVLAVICRALQAQCSISDGSATIAR